MHKKRLPIICNVIHKVVKTLILILALFILSCDTRETSYATMQDAIEHGAVKRGWIPGWLPDDAKSIREAHSLDTNWVMIKFKLVGISDWIPIYNCPSLESDRVDKPPKSYRWWPKLLTDDGNTLPFLKYYKCDHDLGYLVIDEKLKTGYFWSNPH